MSHILIVDDKPENLYLLRMLLQGNGYAVEEASHGGEALDKARRTPPQLLISDILMPVMDGYSLLREWKADPQLRAIPFVVYTATYTNPKDERLALNLGADAFILKPADPDVFMDLIRHVLANNARGTQQPYTPQLEETHLFREYSDALVRKLEDKMRQLEETNRALLADVTERERAEAALTRSTERLRILATASRQFAEGLTSDELLFERIARTIAEALNDYCGIRMLSADGQWLNTVAAYNASANELDTGQLAVAAAPISVNAIPWLQQAMQGDQAVRIPALDPAQIQSSSREDWPDLAQLNDYDRVVAPLRIGGRSIGVIGVMHKRSSASTYDEDDLRLVQDLADRAGLAISHTRLFQQVQAELTERQRAQQVTELLYQASQLLARPLGRDEVLNTLLDVLQQLVPYDSANIMLPDGPDIFRVGYLRGYETWADPEAVKALRFDPTQRPPLAQIIATRHSLLIANTHQEPGWKPMMETRYIGCWLGVPLIANNTLVGIFSIDRHEPDSLTASDVRLAETLAVSAATAIERAQLITELRDERAQLARRVAERTADLSLANAELARAARLKDEFLANMSHELRTPLNGILGRSEALQEELYGPVTPKQVEVLQSVTESGQHLLALINDILDLAKVEAGRLTLERETLDIDMLCTVSMRMVAQIAITKQVSLNTSIDPAAELIVADERRLKQILVNLLSNAVKFTPRGGKIGLEVRSDVERQQVTFTVWDTGIGISEEDLAKLFQPFTQIDSRLNREHDGTGLGLALVRRLAEAHGGSVHVESAVGQGSRFSVILPWNPAEHQTASLAIPNAIDTTQPAVRQVLPIEDLTTVAAQLSRYLQDLGAHVEISSYSTGTVERALDIQPDVIILDILLPNEDGSHVLRELKSEPRTRDIPVIVVSAIDPPERARELGAAEVLLRPIDREMFAAALRRATARTAEPLIERALVATSQQAMQPRVLLAEDNETNIDMLFEYLRLRGYDVTVARNGQEAIVRAEEERPDIILMDIQMPGMDGLEAIRRIRADAILAHTPIIAMTALALPRDRQRCLEAGADEYIAKPVSLLTLVQTIEGLRKRRADTDNDAQNDEAPSTS